MTPDVLRLDGSICNKVIENNTHPPPPYGKHICYARLLGSTVLECYGHGTAAELTLERSSGDQLHRFQFLEPAPSYDLAIDREPRIYTSVRRRCAYASLKYSVHIADIYQA